MGFDILHLEAFQKTCWSQLLFLLAVSCSVTLYATRVYGIMRHTISRRTQRHQRKTDMIPIEEIRRVRKLEDLSIQRSFVVNKFENMPKVFLFVRLQLFFIVKWCLSTGCDSCGEAPQIFSHCPHWFPFWIPLNQPSSKDFEIWFVNSKYKSGEKHITAHLELQGG